MSIKNLYDLFAGALGGGGGTTYPSPTIAQIEAGSDETPMAWSPAQAALAGMIHSSTGLDGGSAAYSGDTVRDGGDSQTISDYVMDGRDARPYEISAFGYLAKLVGGLDLAGINLDATTWMKNYPTILEIIKRIDIGVKTELDIRPDQDKVTQDIADHNTFGSAHITTLASLNGVFNQRFEAFYDPGYRASVINQTALNTKLGSLALAVGKLEVKPSTSRFEYTEDGTYFYAMTSDREVWRATHPEGTWTQVATANLGGTLVSGSNRRNGTFKGLPGLLVCAANTEIWVSVDYGVTWNKRAADLPASVYCMGLAGGERSSVGLVVGGGSGDVYCIEGDPLTAPVTQVQIPPENGSLYGVPGEITHIEGVEKYNSSDTFWTATTLNGDVYVGYISSPTAWYSKRDSFPSFFSVGSLGKLGRHASLPFSAENEEVIVLLDTGTRMYLMESGPGLAPKTSAYIPQSINVIVPQPNQTAIGYCRYGFCWLITPYELLQLSYKALVSNNSPVGGHYHKGVAYAYYVNDDALAVSGIIDEGVRHYPFAALPDPADHAGVTVWSEDGLAGSAGPLVSNGTNWVYLEDYTTIASAS